MSSRCCRPASGTASGRPVSITETPCASLITLRQVAFTGAWATPALSQRRIPRPAKGRRLVGHAVLGVKMPAPLPRRPRSRRRVKGRRHDERDSGRQQVHGVVARAHAGTTMSGGRSQRVEPLFRRSEGTLRGQRQPRINRARAVASTAPLCLGFHDDCCALGLEVDAVCVQGRTGELVSERQGAQRHGQSETLGEQQPAGLIQGRITGSDLTGSDPERTV